MFRRHFSSCKKLVYNQPWAVSEDGVVKFESLTNKSLDGAIKVIRESFMKTESLCKAVGLLHEPGAVEELLQTCHTASKDGVSIVANDTRTNEIVGVIFNQIQVLAPKGESLNEKLSKKSKHKAVKAFFDFTVDVETKADVFKLYNTNCVMELMYISTLPYYMKRNVARLLVLSTFKMAQLLYNGADVKTPMDNENGEITNADAIPTIMAALATSNITQKMSEKLGFDNVVEVNYDDYSFDGKRFSERIGDEHKTCRLVAKRADRQFIVM